MCFSASASFTAAAFLIPTGVYCVYSSIELKRYHYLALALIPFFFGVQQAIEGGVWLSMAAHSHHYTRLFSIGFLFFSHFFWPFWIPLSAYFISRNCRSPRAWIKAVFAVLGTVLGLIFFIPFLFNAHLVQTRMCARSIQYSTTTILHAILGTSLPKYLYIAIIILPLWISRDWAIKLFGLLILASVIVTYVLYSYAFNSVWCFFSAIISMFVVYLIRRPKAHSRNFVIKSDD
jgi:hypothetical protein